MIRGAGHIPLTHLPDYSEKLRRFGGLLVQRKPDQDFQLAGYSWQGVGDGVDVAEVLYFIRGDGAAERIVRASVRLSSQTGLPDMAQLSLRHHVFDSLGNDPREPFLGTSDDWQQLELELAAASWEEVHVIVDDRQVLARTTTYRGWGLASFTFAGLTVTSIAPSPFGVGNFETVRELQEIQVG